MGVIEPNTIYSIGGISGSGKSSFVNSLETDLFDLNKDIDFVVLSFNYEIDKCLVIPLIVWELLKRTISSQALVVTQRKVQRLVVRLKYTIILPRKRDNL